MFSPPPPPPPIPFRAAIGLRFPRNDQLPRHVPRRKVFSSTPSYGILSRWVRDAAAPLLNFVHDRRADAAYVPTGSRHHRCMCCADHAGAIPSHRHILYIVLFHLHTVCALPSHVSILTPIRPLLTHLLPDSNPIPSHAHACPVPLHCSTCSSSSSTTTTPCTS